jgi:hypothetical protein
MRRSRFGKGVALVLVAAVGALSAGCFGKFQLTRKVYDINQSIDEKYVRSAATWILVIVQVYTVAALLDLIVFNVLEFWTGENPVASGPVTKVYAHGTGRTVLSFSRDGSVTVAVIERYEGERLVSTLRVRDDGRGKVAAVETVEGRAVREVSAVAASGGSVDVTVATAAGEGTERYAAPSVRAQEKLAARIASEVAQASRGAAAVLPLSAASRYELRAAGVPPQQEKRGARVPAFGG